MNDEKRRILSVMPAEGWYAEFDIGNDLIACGRLAAWAHYKDEADITDDYLSYGVAGLMPDDGQGYLDWADDSGNFLRYSYLPTATETWFERVDKREKEGSNDTPP